MRAGVPIAVAAVVFSANAGAASVPNTFSSGDPAVASEVNANFDALISEIEAIQSSVDDSTSTTFDNYSMTPSGTGSLGTRNAIVWKQEAGTPAPVVGTAEGNCYIARGWFTNETDITVEGASGPVTPDEVWIWHMACTNQAGDQLTFEMEYRYAVPSSGGFSSANAVEINVDEDGDGTYEAETGFDYAYSSTRTPLSNSELLSANDLYLDGSGEIVTATNFSMIRRSLDRSITVNGMTFDNVMVSSFVGIERVRFHAEGIGPVLELNGGANSDPVYNSEQDRRGVIFYRMDGQEQGDLSGTPFAAGMTKNTWFQQ